MEPVFQELFKAILEGGPGAVTAVLLVVVAFLLLEVRRLRGEVQKKDERLDKIADDFYQSSMTLAEALNSLKVLLHEMKAKL